MPTTDKVTARTFSNTSSGHSNNIRGTKKLGTEAALVKEHK